MTTAYEFLALSGILTVLLWTPYIVARLFVWGLPTFLSNYPEGFPAKAPEQPLWAERAQRTHLNMVETMPGLIAVVVAAGALVTAPAEQATIGSLVQAFFYIRIVHAIVYILGLPFLRTPVYLASWACVLAIGFHALT